MYDSSDKKKQDDMTKFTLTGVFQVFSFQRCALPIEIQNSDIPIAIGLSNSYLNIGLT